MLQPTTAPHEVLSTHSIWHKGLHGGYCRLFLFDEIAEMNLGLKGVGGVYIAWHAGVKPEWLIAGVADDLEFSLQKLHQDPDIREYETYGRVYFSWALIKKEYRDGVVYYLDEFTQTIFKSDFDRSTKKIPVELPH